VFRFGGGNPENVTVSNCIINETYGCPIKMQFGPDARVQNLVFSDLILQDVTGPITISLNNRRRQDAPPPTEKGYLRNITFRGIRASVVSEGRQYSDMTFTQNYRPGETRQCIVLNALDDMVMEDIRFDDVRITYGGGGTMEEAQREIPQVAGEYFDVGTPPAYGLYARNVRGLALNNVRFDVAQADLRPAVVLDKVTDATLHAFSAQGNPGAKSVVRLMNTQDVLVSAARVLTPAAAFVAVEGTGIKGITIDGGDLSKAGSAVAFEGGAAKDGVKVRG
jgi:hypothetical protein